MTTPKLTASLALAMFGLLWEGDYHLPGAPGEDELYLAVQDALAQAFRDPAIRRELQEALRTKGGAPPASR